MDKLPPPPFEPKLEFEKIPFMHWGIISRYNFSNLRNVPIKRWDPLSSTTIEFAAMKQYGHYTYISPVRAERVDQYKDREKPEEPHPDFIDAFKATLDGHEYFDDEGRKIGDAFSILIGDGENRLEDPFSVEPRIKQTHERAITFINKYPAMVRVIEPEIKDYIEKQLEANSKLARGVCLVTTSREYGENLAQLGPENTKALFKSLITGIKYVVEESNKKDIQLIPVSPFFNIGHKVGGSVPRLPSGSLGAYRALC